MSENETQTHEATRQAHDTVLSVYVTRIDADGRVYACVPNVKPFTADRTEAHALLANGATIPTYARVLTAMQDYLQGRQDYAAMRCEVREMIMWLYNCGYSTRRASDWLEVLWGAVEQAHKADTGYIN